MRKAVLIIMIIAFSAPAFSEHSEEGPLDAPVAQEVSGETFTAAVDEDGVQRVEITGGDYYFKPSQIVMKAGVPAEITVRKAPGIVPHNIVMDSPEAGMKFKVNYRKEGEVIRFTPTKPGLYHFYCDKKLLFFKSHREKGMQGVIEVVE